MTAIKTTHVKTRATYIHEGFLQNTIRKNRCVNYPLTHFIGKTTVAFLWRALGDHGSPEFGIAPRLPALFILTAYNVPYIAGVVASQVVLIN